MEKTRKRLRKKKLAKRQPTWTTGNGAKIPIYKMEDSHILNTCRFLIKSGMIFWINVPNDPPYSLPYTPTEYGKKKFGGKLLDALIDDYERRRIDPACVEEERGPPRILGKYKIDEEKTAKNARQFKEMLERRAFPPFQKPRKKQRGKVRKGPRSEFRSVGEEINTLNKALSQQSRGGSRFKSLNDLQEAFLENSSQLNKIDKALGLEPKSRFAAIAESLEDESKQVSKEDDVKLDPRFKNILVDDDKQVESKSTDSTYISNENFTYVEIQFVEDMTFLVERFNEGSFDQQISIGKQIQGRLSVFQASVPYKVTIDSDRDIFKQTTQFVISSKNDVSSKDKNLIYFELKI